VEKLDVVGSISGAMCQWYCPYRNGNVAQVALCPKLSINFLASGFGFGEATLRSSGGK
jgi:hypothetical protein